MLVLLVAVGILLFQALHAVLAAVLALLAPAFALFQALVVVAGLIALVAVGLVRGSTTAPDRPGRLPHPSVSPTRSAPATPPARRSLPSKRPVPSMRPVPVPPAKASLAAPEP